MVDFSHKTCPCPTSNCLFLASIAARLVYAEEIFDWTDAYSETYSGGEEGTEEGQLKLQRLRCVGRYGLSDVSHNNS